MYLRINRLLVERGMTANELCDQLNIGTSTISNLKNKDPTSETLIKIAVFLEVSTDYLMGLTDMKNLNSKSLILTDNLLPLYRVIKDSNLLAEQEEVIFDAVINIVKLS